MTTSHDKPAPSAPPLDVEAIRARASFVVATGGSSTPRGAETSTGIGLVNMAEVRALCDEVLFLRAEVERLRVELTDTRTAQRDAMTCALHENARSEQAERERDEARAEVDNLRADLAAALARERNAVAMVRTGGAQSVQEGRPRVSDSGAEGDPPRAATSP